jgi:putative phage-type endonuclease
MLPKQNTPEWLEFRKDKIGASEAAIIMGVSPWSTPYQLWCEKMGISDPKELSAAMQRGHDLEQKARDFFEQESRIPIYPKVVLHPALDWMMASIDGISADLQTVVEIKCPGSADHSLAKKGEIPAKYIPQLQHQMAVCQVNHMFYLSFDGTEGIIIPVERDDSYILKLVDAEMAFWDCMNTFRAPELCDRDYVQREDYLWVETAMEWSEIRNKIQQLQEREDELRSLLSDMSDGKNCSGGGVKVSRIVRKGNIDYSSIPEIKNVCLEVYRKPNTTFIKITSTMPF